MGNREIEPLKTFLSVVSFIAGPDGSSHRSAVSAISKVVRGDFKEAIG